MRRERVRNSDLVGATMSGQMASFFVQPVEVSCRNGPFYHPAQKAGNILHYVVYLLS